MANPIPPNQPPVPQNWGSSGVPTGPFSDQPPAHPTGWPAPAGQPGQPTRPGYSGDPAAHPSGPMAYPGGPGQLPPQWYPPNQPMAGGWGPSGANLPVPPGVSGPAVSQLRHWAEMPFVFGGLAVTIVAGLIAVGLISSGETELPTWALAALLGLLSPVIAFIMIRYQFWSVAANGIPVTPQQLPELHAIYAELMARMEVPWQPNLYVVNGNGLLNAFAAKCQLRRAYITLYSDLVDVAYELNDFTAVKFVLAHELGHVKCRHVSLWRLITTNVVRFVGLDASIIRAQEYSADRCASYYVPEGARTLVLLYAGKRVYRNVDIEAYMASVAAHKDGFWLKVVNLFSSHPVGFRRMTALYQVQSRGWNIHGKML